MLAVACRGVEVWRGGRQVLAPFDWEVHTRTLVAVIGPNGGGKSTLLATLLGLLTPVRGQVEIFGQSPRAARSRVAYLPQEDQVEWSFPLSVYQVVLQGRLPGRPFFSKPTLADRDAALAALERMGLSGLLHRPIGALSGGQRQKVFLARALAQGADLILLDEPTTGLDAAAQHDLLVHLQELREQGRTVIMVTHDLSCISEHFDSLACIDGGLVASGPVHSTLTPELITRLFGRHFPLITTTGEVRFAHHHS